MADDDMDAGDVMSVNATAEIFIRRIIYLMGHYYKINRYIESVPHHTLQTANVHIGQKTEHVPQAVKQLMMALSIVIFYSNYESVRHLYNLEIHELPGEFLNGNYWLEEKRVSYGVNKGDLLDKALTFFASQIEESG